MPVGEHPQAHRHVRVVTGVNPQRRQRVAGQRIGAALERDELRLRGVDEGLARTP